ncbi:HD-domain/PDEase-like protein [Hyphopichia burtonii NRRL Y-1933]|uniref:Phosphodiesterase n=1 Tax=Hyphopichia burtonii NRRL Y-1933 TaxID=984485 RepID=A0A1E4RR47_9ASCO|nr:HD-domain/PDEase-like protein [Hyphopichia burtonii NRRL Y-1933]ODV69535.1 HD-domain/PDEase-like protein [Hyphopichia burtonii NRRL Y-1933]
MAEVLCLSYSLSTPSTILGPILNIHNEPPCSYQQKFWDKTQINNPNYHPNYFTRFKQLISHLFIKGNQEQDTNHPTIIAIDTLKVGVSLSSKLDLLKFEDKSLLLKYFFNHLNVIVVDLKSLESMEICNQLNNCIIKINKLIKNRINRVQTWTGVGNENVNDQFIKDEEDLRFQIDGIISTMSFVLNHNLNTSLKLKNQLIKLNSLIMSEVDFKSLLSKNSDYHLSKLCHLVGHWSFPAHELTNDDLIYCVFIMIKYSLDQLQNDYPKDLYLPNENELLGFVFMVRDTYKNGNPFHNFRHAVDVLQACFHYLVRLNCLAPFKQLENDPKSNELLYLNDETPILKSTILLPINEASEEDSEEGESNHSISRKSSASFHSTTTSKILTTTTTLNNDTGKPLSIHASQSISFDSSEAHLTPLQTFGLLIAALGHDVGHPGVTNAFMIEYDSPTSLLYNERSVLESFHSSIFINKILSINWPGLLEVETDPEFKLSFKQLIISCILATDMAEHFEYIDKLTTFKLDLDRANSNKVKLISSLLIKCADISNVTRPLRVSSQWAAVLSREFNEVTILQNKINNDDTDSDDIHYSHVPSDLDSILSENPNLHKGQIFFIDTFAENLFHNIVELLPELKYTCDIILENKDYWYNRSQNS